MHKYTAWVGLTLLLGACSPIVEVTKIGNEYAQDAHSRKFWWGNWQRVTYCWKLDSSGYCPKEDTRVETHTQIAIKASGHEAAVGAAASAPIGLGLGLGLANMQAARMTQSVVQSSGGVNQPINTSTLLINGPVPPGVAR